MTQRTLVFDLDGTLIDSAPSILLGYAAAFEATGLTPQRPLTADLVGPPLRSTLRQVLGRSNDAALDALVDAFKRYYDRDGFRASQVYAGIDTLLSELSAQGAPLYLATNKRWHPTERILDHLGWTQHFRAAHALDGPQPPAANKGALLRWMVSAYGLQASECLYVGDRDEDGEAADAAGMPFQRVPWGYGPEQDEILPPLQATKQLAAALKAWLA
jgi:phosphoglycolate phosphatase